MEWKELFKLQNYVREAQKFEGFHHALLTPDYAKKIAGFFGKDCTRIIDIVETSTEPKGYHGKTAEGVPAFELSEWLCRELELEYRGCYGRGSQHQECCTALKLYAEKKIAEFAEADEKKKQKKIKDACKKFKPGGCDGCPYIVAIRCPENDGEEGEPKEYWDRDASSLDVPDERN